MGHRSGLPSCQVEGHHSGVLLARPCHVSLKFKQKAKSVVVGGYTLKVSPWGGGLISLQTLQVVGLLVLMR